MYVSLSGWPVSAVTHLAYRFQVLPTLCRSVKSFTQHCSEGATGTGTEAYLRKTSTPVPWPPLSLSVYTNSPGNTGSPVAWKAVHTTVYHNLLLSQPSPGRCALQDPSSAAAFGSWTSTSLHRPMSAPPGSGDSILSGAPDKSPALPWCLCFSQTSHEVHCKSSRLLLQNIPSLQPLLPISTATTLAPRMLPRLLRYLLPHLLVSPLPSPKSFLRTVAILIFFHTMACDSSVQSPLTQTSRK